MEFKRGFISNPKFLAPLASFLAYLNSLDSQFVYDDTRAILQNADLHPSTPWSNLLLNDFWGTPMSHNGSHKSYRPLCTFSFRLNYFFSGYNPFGYHLVNVICHMAVTFMVTLLAGKLRMSKLGILLTGCFFALHPIHTEAVSGIVGRADLLSAFFYLIAITSYLEHIHHRDKSEIFQNDPKQCDKNGNYEKPRKISKPENQSTYLKNFYLCATLCSASCAMFSKEQGITCLGICFIYDLVKLSKHRTQILYQFRKGYCQNIKKILSSLTVLLGSLAFLLYIRARAMGFTSPSFAKSDNPASGSNSFLVRMMTFSYLPVLNFALLLSPSTLSFDWSMESVPLIQSVLDPRNTATVLFYSILGLISIKIVTNLWRNQHSGLPAISLAMIVLPFLPATNLFFYVGFVVAERVLYIPSIGYCLLLGFTLAKLIESSRRYSSTISALVIVLLIIFGLKTISRNKDWKNEENLYRSGIPVNPPKALGNLGNVWTQQGHYKKAEWAFRKALSFKNNMADVHYNLGVLLQQQKRTQESISSYNEAIKYRPNMALAHMNLGIAMYDIGLKSEALSILLNIEKLQDDGTKDPKSHFITQVGSLFNAGKFCLETGRTQHAITILLKAKSMGELIKYNNQQGILNLLGEAYMAANNSAEAELWYRAALTEKPDHVPAYLTYGKLLAKNKTRVFEAENFFLRAKAISPDDFNVHLHYGLYLMDLERFAEAASNFEKAANLKRLDYEANFNAGVAFRQAGNYQKAEDFYRRAVKIMPQDPSSHMNLGAMLHLAGKLMEAESEYMISWKLRPEDQSTRTNIQRLHNVMKKKGLKIKVLDPL